MKTLQRSLTSIIFLLASLATSHAAWLQGNGQAANNQFLWFTNQLSSDLRWHSYGNSNHVLIVPDVTITNRGTFRASDYVNFLQALDDVALALTGAANATTLANAAQTAADDAQTAADAAQADADTADAAAAAAQSTANTGVSNAATAQSAANMAQATANAAGATAGTANSTANTALANAATAQSDATTALGLISSLNNRVQAVVASSSLPKTNTTFTDVPNLSVTLEANSSYTVEVSLPFSLAGALSGAKFNFVGPSGATFQINEARITNASGTAPLGGVGGILNGLGSLVQAILLTGNFTYAGTGTIKTGGTGGTFKIQFAQNVANGSAATITDFANLTVIRSN